MLRGGLPHEQTSAALALLFATTPALPTWPLLPNRSGRDPALVRAASGFPGLTADAERVLVDRTLAEAQLDRLGLAYLRDERTYAALPADLTTSLGDLLRFAEGRPYQALSAELLGPVSLSLLLVDHHERPLAYEPALREAILHHLALRLGWLHEQLSSAGRAVVICIAEPLLAGLDLPFGPLDHTESLLLLSRLLSALPGSVGLCVDTTPHWAELLALPIDLLLFNAYDHSADLLQAAASVAGFLDRGGCLGWGIVPADAVTLTQERIETLAQRLISAVEFLATTSGITTQRIYDAMIISTSASLAALSIQQAEHALQLCAAVAHYVREQRGVTEGS